MNVSIYQLDLSASNPLLRAELLDAQEQQRAERFVNEHLRAHYVRSHAFLRLVLARYLGLDPSAIQYNYESSGKPFIKNASIFFNLSHSGDLAVVAVSKAGPVGVDVEQIRSFPDALDVAKRFFSKAEYESLLACSELNRFIAFFQLWAQKEAYLKMLGLGVGYGLSRFSVRLEPGFNNLVSTEAQSELGQDCHLGLIQVNKNYAAAIAAAKTSSLFIDYCDF